MSCPQKSRTNGPILVCARRIIAIHFISSHLVLSGTCLIFRSTWVRLLRETNCQAIRVPSEGRPATDGEPDATGGGFAERVSIIESGN